MIACILVTADRSACHRPALVEIEDIASRRAWGCPDHAAFALYAIHRSRLVRDLRTDPTGNTR